MCYDVSCRREHPVKYYRRENSGNLQNPHHFPSLRVPNLTSLLRPTTFLQVSKITHFAAKHAPNMGAFERLPNEILHEIVTYLADERWKQDHYNPIKIKNLQTARLVCASMNRVATPFLFENMVLDEKFCEDKDLNMLLIFANENPTLAGFVQRLKRKIVPCVGPWSREFRTCVLHQLTSDETIKPPADSEICDERAPAFLKPRYDSHPDRSGLEVGLEDSVNRRRLVPKYCQVCPGLLDCTE